MKREKYPDKGESVVVKITNVLPYGAKGALVEYGNKEGFIHISQISNSWIKNIRSFVSENSIRVAKVTSVDSKKNQIDISLRKISSSQEKRKLTEWKREKRADKLFEKLCKDIKEDYKKVYPQIIYPLEDEFGDLMSAFEVIKTNPEVLEDFNFSKKWNKALTDFAEKNITLSTVTAYGDLSLSLKTGDAIETIKEILSKIDKKEDVDVEYISAPKYRLIATGLSFQDAEERINRAANFCIGSLEKVGGKGFFEKVQMTKR